jgi:hypothetical protein
MSLCTRLQASLACGVLAKKHQNASPLRISKAMLPLFHRSCDHQPSLGTTGTDSAGRRCSDAGSVCALVPRRGWNVSSRRYATECVGLSVFARAERPRWMLLQMAIAWSELARQAERTDQNDIVYETPLPSSQSAVNKPGE